MATLYQNTIVSENCNATILKTQAIYWKSWQKKLAFLDLLRQVRSGEKSLDLPEDRIEQVYGIGKKWQNFQESLEACGEYLEFNYYPRPNKTKLQRANFCKKDKLCPACAVRRAYKQQMKFMQSLEASSDLLDQDWYYIVLPVKHNKDEGLLTVYEKVNKVKKAISQSIRDGKKGKSNNIWTLFSGAMYSIEITKTPNGWNVHLNLLINCPKDTYIELRGYWDRSKQRFNYQNPDLENWLRMKAEGSFVHSINKIEFADKEEIRSNLVEILKYALKFASLSLKDLAKVYADLYRKNLFGTFGNLRGLNLEEVELEGDILPDEDFVQIITQRSGLYYKLLKVSELKRGTSANSAPAEANDGHTTSQKRGSACVPAEA